MLVLAHEALRARAGEPGSQSDNVSEGSLGFAQRVSPDDYVQLVSHVREAVAQVVPSGTRLLICSRGDDALLVPGYDAVHFPQGQDGRYAGYYPADSHDAIAHLERCRAGGEAFFVLPGTAFWWLDYYGGFAQHLLTRCRVAYHDRKCLIVHLRSNPERVSSA
jgi:hypothetical protein